MSKLVTRQEVGQLDQRVIIKRDVLTSDGGGGQTNSPVVVDTVWASVKPSTGSERQRFERLDAEAMFTFVIRNRSDLDLKESDRLVWQSIDHNIRFIADPGPRELYVTIMAERGVAQ